MRRPGWGVKTPKASRGDAWRRHWASHYGLAGPVTFGWVYRTLYDVGLLDWSVSR